MVYLYYDIIKIIYDKLDLRSQIKYRQLCCEAYIFDITRCFAATTEKILANCSRYITNINVGCDSRLLNICNFDKITRLDAAFSYIVQSQINKLNMLTHLNISGCLYITNLNHLKHLKVLNIARSNVTQSSIKSLRNLTELNMCGQSGIYDLNHLVKLQILDISMSNMQDSGFNCLKDLRRLRTTRTLVHVASFTKLQSLDAPYADLLSIPNGLLELHTSIFDQIPLNQLKNLQILHIGNGNHCRRIKSFDISGLINLTELDIMNVPITYFKPNLGLQKLVASGYNCGLTQIGIMSLTMLRTLDVSGNNHVNDVNHLEFLETLMVGRGCGVNQAGIQKLRNITYLNVNNNPRITDLNHLDKLQYLHATGRDCRISRKSISQLQNLKYLDNFDNNNLRNITVANYRKKTSKACVIL